MVGAAGAGGGGRCSRQRHVSLWDIANAGAFALSIGRSARRASAGGQGEEERRMEERSDGCA